jgi:hypothetical protein
MHAEPGRVLPCESLWRRHRGRIFYRRLCAVGIRWKGKEKGGSESALAFRPTLKRPPPRPSGKRSNVAPSHCHASSEPMKIAARGPITYRIDANAICMPSPCLQSAMHLPRRVAADGARVFEFPHGGNMTGARLAQSRAAVPYPARSASLWQSSASLRSRAAIPSFRFLLYPE